MTISPYVIPGLNNAFKVAKKGGYSSKEIIGASCKFLEVTTEQIMKKDRRRFIVERRMMIMYYLFEKCEYSKSDIARFFERDHTSVLHSLKTIKLLIDMDETIKERWNALTIFLR